MRITLGEIKDFINARTVSLHSWLSPLQPIQEEDEAQFFKHWEHYHPLGAAIDSRLVRDDMIFFCFSGEHSDGHDFICDVAKKGAMLIVASKEQASEAATAAFLETVQNIPVFIVPDVGLAMRQIASVHRETALAKVIGITGTAGKTTVKDALIHVLSTHAFTAYSKGNNNNQIGLPLSMLNASAEATYWVMELGISQENDMDELGRLLAPDLALILNVGLGHTEGLGEKGVAYHKAQLFQYVQQDGVVVYSLDYEDLVNEVEAMSPMLEEKGIKICRFSTNIDAEAECVGVFNGNSEEGGSFTVYCDKHKERISAPFAGAYGAENVAAVTTVANVLGLHLFEVIRGLREAKLPNQRFFTVSIGSFTIIDDSYNANPLSMERMLDAAALLAKENNVPLFLVLGEMGELGANANSAHYNLGKKVAALNPQAVFWFGAYGDEVQSALCKAGCESGFYVIEGVQSFLGLLREFKPESGVFLFKGSRINKLELLVKEFTFYLEEQEAKDAV